MSAQRTRALDDRREWMGSGGPRGLQILPSGANPTRGGFDSHTFPPPSLRRALAPLAALLIAALLAGPALAVAPRRHRPSPTRATLESLVVPGLGQYRSGQPVRALFALGLESYLVGRAVLEEARARDDDERARTEATSLASANLASAAEHRQSRDSFLFWTVMAHMYNLLDAYVSAHLADVDEEIDDVRRVTWRLEPSADGGDLAVAWAF